MSLTPIENDAYLILELDVEIGDRENLGFKPKFKLKRWAGECSLGISLGAEEVEYELERDAEGNTTKIKLKVKIGDLEFESELYSLNPTAQYEYGAFEFEIILKKKPANNSMILPIETENLRFLYQPPLTEEFKQEDCEIWTPTHIKTKDGEECFRPENVVGSLAYYHSSKRNNRYKTGKMGHLFRPLLIDALGNEAWGEYNRDPDKDGFLKITLPQDFLHSAVYPVSIDPTFGKTDIGGSTGTHSANYVNSFRHDLSESGTVTQMDVYLSMSSGVKMTCGIYDDSSEDPNNLEGISSEYTCLESGSAWRTVTCSIPLTGPASYHLDFITDTQITSYWDSFPSNYWHYVSSTYPTHPNPFGTPTGASTRSVSIYATYTTAGLSIPVAMHHLKMQGISD